MDGESDELDFLYTWQWFERARDVYARAARERLGVLFTVRDAALRAPGPGTGWSLSAGAVLDRWIP